MKERPILFNGEMVRAILDGRKTMTRRVVKPQPFEDPKWGLSWAPRGIAENKPIYCERNANFNPITKAMTEVGAPLGTIGDRLWVRETFRIYNSASECACYDECKCASVNGKPLYRASDPSPDDDKWTPSIHMPRWASRITLEVTGVRVERVADITEEDAKAEGCEGHPVSGHNGFPNGWAPRDEFQDLWQSIYSNWDANPWVWVYQIRRIKP